MLARIGRWGGILAATLAAILVLVALNLAGRAERALPDYAGNLSLPGLAAPVEIVRDRHAIPHIYAASDGDAAFALGVTHAQDRLWQMEMFRRVVQGRLAEIFGAAALPADRLVRTLDLHGRAARSLDVLAPEVREAIEAYAAGVNAYLAAMDRPLPPEFQLLWHEPEPWQAADSVALVKLLGAGLSGNAFGEILRTRMLENFDDDALRTFDPPYPADAKPAVREMAGLYRSLGLARILAAIPDTGPPGASNNWVVDGSWTRSGRPLLANDPHLGMMAPSIWYAAHTHVAGHNVIGVSIPGIPSIILGRNDAIAWGFTNTGPDTQDLVVERLDPDNPGNYLTPDGPRAFDTRIETLRVRFGSDETLEIRETRNGPVLDALDGEIDDILADGHVIALRWTALSDRDTTVEAGFRFTKAESVAEFDEAARLHVAPMQNMVVADTAGNIGMIAPARVPVRGPDHDTGGLLPAAGWKAENDWKGFIPHEGLPRIVNPPHGYVATANNRIIPSDFPYYIASSWEPPYRATRIEQMIEARRDHDVETFEIMLADNLSLFALDMLPHLIAVEPRDRIMQEALDLLSIWDARMEKDLPQPLIFHAWLRQLHKHLYADELGDLAEGSARRRETLIANALAGDPAAAAWCDNIKTGSVESCPDIVGAALAAALDDLSGLYGGAPADWRWGDAHPVVNNHLPMGFIPGLRALFNIERPSAGGPYTVNRGQTGSGARPFANVHAAGYRAVFDFADLDNSRFVISTGQSGNPASLWYDTFASLWADGGHIPLTTDRQAIKDGAIGTLTLTPSPTG